MSCVITTGQLITNIKKMYNLVEIDSAYLVLQDKSERVITKRQTAKALHLNFIELHLFHFNSSIIVFDLTTSYYSLFELTMKELGVPTWIEVRL